MDCYQSNTICNSHHLKVCQGTANQAEGIDTIPNMQGTAERELMSIKSIGEVQNILVFESINVNQQY